MSKSSLERLRHALDQRGEQIDAEAHVAGLDDRSRVFAAASIFASSSAVSPVVPMMWTRAVRAVSSGEHAARGRHREIDDAVGFGEQRLVSARDRDAVLRRARRARRHPDRSRRARGLERAGEREARLSAIALISVRPMRPPAPATTSRMSDIDQISERAGYSGASGIE